MRKFLVVVDLQNDFVTGALGSPEAQAIVPHIVQKIETGGFDAVLFTMDTHHENYLETNEGKHLPVPHCIVGTDGHQLVPQVAPAAKLGCVYHKQTFGSVDLATYISRMERSIESVEFAGVCTDICVLANAILLKTLCPELPISVDASCCAGSTPENHKAALRVLRACHIDIKGEDL